MSHLTFAEAGVVGLLQGITELFPVSSLGHAVLIPAIVGGQWAQDLNVSKPAITRALDRLTELDFVRRKVDPADRRSVLVQRTATGMAFLRELRTILRDAASALRITAEPAPARQRTGSEPARAAH